MGKLHSLRLTCGTYDTGKSFCLIDHWRKGEGVEKPLIRPWAGITVLFDEDCHDIDSCVASICALHAESPDTNMPQRKQVSFNEDLNTYHEVTPYSEVYECHPHRLLSTSQGWKRLPSRADPFTGKTPVVMKARRIQVRKKIGTKSARKARQSILNAANQGLAEQNWKDHHR